MVGALLVPLIWGLDAKARDEHVGHCNQKHQNHCHVVQVVSDDVMPVVFPLPH